jgi:hypothetical protein
VDVALHVILVLKESAKGLRLLAQHSRLDSHLSAQAVVVFTHGVDQADVCVQKLMSSHSGLSLPW